MEERRRKNVGFFLFLSKSVTTSTCGGTQKKKSKKKSFLAKASLAPLPYGAMQKEKTKICLLLFVNKSVTGAATSTCGGTKQNKTNLFISLC